MRARIVAGAALAAALTMPFTLPAQDKKADSKTTDQKLAKEVQDPVCGMMVDPKTAPKTDYKGKTYYFCSLDEKKEFDKDPLAFIKDPSKDKKK